MWIITVIISLFLGWVLISNIPRVMRRWIGIIGVALAVFSLMNLVFILIFSIIGRERSIKLLEEKIVSLEEKDEELKQKQEDTNFLFFIILFILEGILSVIIDIIIEIREGVKDMKKSIFNSIARLVFGLVWCYLWWVVFA